MKRRVLISLVFCISTCLLPSLSRSEENTRRHAILIHGLNQKPAHMTHIASLFGAMGFTTEILRLQGHTYQACRKVSESPLTAWRAQLRTRLKNATEKRILLVGYSLGALLALDVGPSFSSVQGYVLFAPPLELRFKASLLRLLLPLKYFSLSLPSYAPEASRVCDSTPLYYYSAVFQLIAGLRDSFPASKAKRALILIDKDDELVSPGGVRQWIQRYSLEHWEYHELSDTEGDSSAPAHFLVDRARYPDTQWSKIASLIASWLRNTPFKQAAASRIAY